MPHVAFIPFTGLRVREAELRALGMSLPGLRKRATALAELPALAPLTLAGLLPEQWTCSYHEGSGEFEELVENIVAQRPTLAAVSALTASVEDAYRFSRALRARGVPVVIGGLHATACPSEAAAACGSAVVGDGESVWSRVLADAESGTLEPVYRAKGNFPMAESPVPRFDLLGPRQRPRYTLQTARGCPLACDFCGASRLLGSFREKPLANIRRELDAIATVSPRPWLELADDNTFAGERDFDPLLATLAASGARYFTESDWRLGERPDVLSSLAASGCVQVLVGIESLVLRYPGMGEKRAELARVMDAVEAIQAAGVAVNGCFILGADGETRASIDRLVRFVLDSPLAEVQLTLQTPFPGTGLYRRLAREGRLIPERGWSNYTLFDVTYRPDRMPVGELEGAFRAAVQAVFAPAPAARRNAIRREIWSRRRDTADLERSL